MLTRLSMKKLPWRRTTATTPRSFQIAGENDFRRLRCCLLVRRLPLCYLQQGTTTTTTQLKLLRYASSLSASAKVEHERCSSLSSFSIFWQHKQKKTREYINNSFSTSPTVRRHFASVTINEDDPYDKYRGAPATKELWETLRQENQRTQERIDSELTQQILQEMNDVLARQEDALPEYGPTGTWKYQFTVGDDHRRSYQRSRSSSSATTPEPPPQQQLVLEFAPDADILSLSLSVDESCIACLFSKTQSQNNNGTRNVLFRHIDTNRQKVLTVPDSIESLEMGPIRRHSDGQHSVYLVATDSTGRPDRILLASLNLGGEDEDNVLTVSNPTLLFQSDDPAVFVDVQRTKGCQYVAIQAMTKLSNEIFLGNGESESPSSLQLVLPRQDRVQYHLDVGDDENVVLLVSVDGGEYTLMESTVPELPLEATDVNNNRGREVLQDENAITDMDLFQDFLILYERSTVNGSPRIRVQPRGGEESSFSIVPIASNALDCGKVAPAGNIHYHARSLRFEVESPIQSGCVFDYNFDSKVLTQIAGQTPPVGLKQERIFVSSLDGTKIPLSMIYRGSDDEESSAADRPVVLVGYGAYGEPINLGFDPSWAPLVDRGFVIAFAHTRGGGDLGKAWYDAGCRERKVRAIEDFEACAHHLKARWGGQLTARAFSAGGVLVGAAVNRNPNLFHKVVLTNAFLDVYKTLENPKLFLTVHEWDEYGNPIQDPQRAELIRSYCPVSNIVSPSSSPSVSVDFPDSLVIGTLDDENVPYWNAFIFARKAGEVTDNVFLHMEESGQHHLGHRRLPVSAMELAFIIH